jgi:cell wall assembly regulator SMI1/predicted DNA-binding WGR domain protein
MRRFELSDGTSNKFWQIAREGRAHTVTFGRIGTAGQQKQKTFETAELAARDEARLVKEKLAKGYVEVMTRSAANADTGAAEARSSSSLASSFGRFEAALTATAPRDPLLPPAKPAAVKKLERDLGFQLPLDLREWWSLHGGQDIQCKWEPELTLLDLSTAVFQVTRSDSLAGKISRLRENKQAWAAAGLDKVFGDHWLPFAQNDRVSVVMNCETGRIFEVAFQMEGTWRVARSLQQVADTLIEWLDTTAPRLGRPAKVAEISNRRISTALARIKSWMSKHAPELVENLAGPASVSQLDELEQTLGLVLPPDLRDLWSIHDGQRMEGHDFFAGDCWMSTRGAPTALKSAKVMIDCVLADRSLWKAAGARDDEMTSSQWVMFAGHRDGFVVNCATGRVFECQRDTPGLTLVAPSIAEWLERYASDLQAGKYAIDEQFGGLVRRA